MLNHNETTKYLGRKLGFDSYHALELHNRISTAWRQFNALRDELTNKRFPLSSRLRLFDSTITPTILYACVIWTTTKDLTTKILRTQRRMLRLIVNTPRRRTTTSTTTTTNHDDVPQVEPWQEYIKRATTIAERTLSNQHVEIWDVTYLRRKWR